MPAEVTGPRRFPPPWTVQEIEESLVIQGATGQPLAYLYFDDEPSGRTVTKRLMRDQARRIAANIAKATAAAG